MSTGFKPFWNFWQKSLTPAREIGRVDLFLNTGGSGAELASPEPR